MQPERRWATRKSLTADVVVDHQPVGLARGRIANVSVSGLYVKTGAPLPPQSQVELVLMRQTEAGTHVYRIPTTVVRKATEGLGLVVHRYDLDTFRTLVTLLLESDATAAPNDNPGDGAQRPDPVLAGTAGTAEVAVARVVPITPNASPKSGDFD